MVTERLYLKRLKNCQLIEDLGCKIVDIQMEMASIEKQKDTAKRELILKDMQPYEIQKFPETPENQSINEIKDLLLEIQGLDRRISELEVHGLEKEHQFLSLKNQIQREIKAGITELLNENMGEHEKLLKQLSESKRMALEFQREWKDTENEEALYKWMLQSEAVMTIEIQLEKLEEDIDCIERVLKMEFGE
ncbi:hypothetical protein [Methanobacterium aggregans]|uniref:hypothetical protein n=1 Tax=Methanobacterium aggregans TaxID=1615586 RepID=UPI001AEB1D7F|nr:hypothetical protein [Methanobacterium aggregans]MBP2046000.1 cobalamin biosynthesis Mg chelatase CobN [Methanobacterium aggregans]